MRIFLDIFSPEEIDLAELCQRYINRTTLISAYNIFLRGNERDRGGNREREERRGVANEGNEHRCSVRGGMRFQL